MTTTPCVKCGNALEAGARFCGGCGTQQPGAVIPHAAVRTNAKTMFQAGGGPVGARVAGTWLGGKGNPTRAKNPTPPAPLPEAERGEQNPEGVR